MNCGLAMSSDHPLSHHSDKHDQDFDDSNAGSFLLQPSGVRLSVKYNLPFSRLGPIWIHAGLNIIDLNISRLY